MKIESTPPPTQLPDVTVTLTPQEVVAIRVILGAASSVGDGRAWDTSIEEVSDNRELAALTGLDRAAAVSVMFNLFDGLEKVTNGWLK